MMFLDKRMKKWLWPPQGWTWRPLHPNPSYSASFSTPQTRMLSKSRSLPVTLECGFLLWPCFPFLWVLPGMPSRILSTIWSGHTFCRTFLTPSVLTGSSRATARQSSLFYVQGLPPCQGEFFCPTLFSQQTRASCYTPENSEKAISQQPAGEPRRLELSPWHRTTLPKRHGGSRNWAQTLRGWCLCLARQLHWFLFLKVWQNFRNIFGIYKNCLVLRVFQTHKVEQPWLFLLSP